ncbi:lysine N(6)-hydroxylase/L-ornithine N(5)-oxygenase family protein [Nonomuraea rhizosphaerae]|uniref:lysine N(6)-hydroxylase/L-ornithine N(5)-oxygenase family protein n=1 Tax=Nonomuraea rhizosphaerae TaxID=2665663 RepID=UPI0027E22AEE|nr:SidA/IucD/PvdA family monooxygenase [Nonomuraea rhizosphaerae]
METLLSTLDSTYDIVGIGFGPSNLALAIALEEHNAQVPAPEQLRVGFLEKQSGFGWHRGMLLEDATMQVSFLKDLVTMRDPASDFSFLCFLKQSGRLEDFLNHKTFFPLRIEFHAYFEWAAERVRDLVEYSSEVVSVEPVTGKDGEVHAFDVISRDPRDPERTIVRRARNIAVATGLEPHLPPGTVVSDRVWHNSELLPRVAAMKEEGIRVRRAVVLGAGQSAAETTDYLHRTFTDAEVCAVFAKYGFTPADDSPFANQIFDPEAVDTFFGAPSSIKQELLEYHRGTNYSVVDMDLIESLYRTMYREKVQGAERLRLLRASRIREVREQDDKLDVEVEYLPTGGREVLEADLLVHATGYRPQDIGAVLGRTAKLCLRDEEDGVRIGRDYRVETQSHVSAGIYLQGAGEHTHGLTSTLLSTIAIRAGEIRESLLAHRAPKVGAAR